MNNSSQNKYTNLSEYISSAAYERAAIPIYVLANNRILDCNPAAAAYLGFDDKSNCISVHPTELAPEYQPDGQSSVAKAAYFREKCYREGHAEFFWTHRTQSGQLNEAYVRLLDISYQNKRMVLASVIDIKALQKEFGGDLENNRAIDSINYNLLNEHKKVIDFSSIVSKTDAAGKIVYANKKFCDISGYEMEELLGRDHSVINHPDVPKALFKDLWLTIRAGKIWQGVIQNRKKNGESYFVDSTISPIFNTDGEIVEYIAIRNDITSLIEKEKVIVFQNTDRQSRLPNKTKLYSDLKKSLGAKLAVLDVYELEAINQITTKQQFTDLLRDIVSHLRSLVTRDLTLYRTGEYQFTLVSKVHNSIESFADFCKKMANRFEETGFQCQNKTMNLSLFVGVAENFAGMDPYINAIHAIKLAEGSCEKINVYKPQRKLLKAIEETVGWTQSIKHALQSDGFAIFGQKIFDREQNTYSTEVLMRHHDHEKDTFTSPYFFLDYACKAKLYNKLTQLVFEKAFAHFADSTQRFSLNVTYMDICDAVTMGLLEQLLEQYQCGNRVTIELVESDSLDIESEFFTAFLALIKRFNCQLAIDDFGSGYSNFNYLTQIPVDIVKIDGSLVRDIDINERHFVTVKAIVEICHALGVKVVAEYVANQSIYETLCSLNIEYFQGYLFDKPSALHQSKIISQSVAD